MMTASGGGHQQHDVPAAHPALVEPAHALGVDQRGAEPEAGQEGRRHARPTLVQELDHRGVGAHGDDQLGARLVGQDHRRVLRGALDDELLVVHAEGLELLEAGVVAAGVDVVDQVLGHVEGVGGDRVEVADDHVRAQPTLEQGVGPTVDADQHRLVLGDVRPQGPQVLLVVVAPHHDEGVAAVQVGVQRWQDQRGERQLRLLARRTPTCSRRSAAAPRRSCGGPRR